MVAAAMATARPQLTAQRSRLAHVQPRLLLTSTLKRAARQTIPLL
jgi:hypothetical protein